MNKSFFNKLSVKEQAVFARRLSFLIRAHIPILEALMMIRRQARTKARQKMLDQIITDVSNGQFLSKSMDKFRSLFGNFTVDIIRIGEESGMLDENLNYLADELQKRQALQRKVIGSLVYPFFITLATIAITALIVVYIFPKILPIFKTMHVALPLTTRVLMAVSSVLIQHGLVLVLLLLALIIGFIVLLQYMPRFRRIVHHGVLRLPLFGRLLKSYYVTTFCRTFGLLLRSHFSIIKAAQVTAETSANMAYQEELAHLADEITHGRKISDHLARHTDLFPDMVSEMIAIGEKTGNLSDTLLYLAGYYENEVEEITKNLSSSLEPILMVAMGAVVGFVAISVITPIYAITQNLHH